MCRTGGRRCPSHTDPLLVAERNARRRNAYNANKKVSPQGTPDEISSYEVHQYEDVASFTPETEPMFNFNERSSNWSEYTEAAAGFLAQLKTQPAEVFEAQQSSLYDYTAFQYKKIRDYLTGYVLTSLDKEPLELEDSEVEVLQNICNNLDTALSQADKPDKPRKLYRGMSIPSHVEPENISEWIAQNLPVGGVISQKHYMSTTFNAKKANQTFGRGGPGKGVLFEILSKQGATLGADTSTYGNMETEVLMPREAKFKIVAIKTEGFIMSETTDTTHSEYSAYKEDNRILVQLVDAD